MGVGHSLVPVPRPFHIHPSLAACSTNAWQTDHMQWHAWTLGGHVEEWHIPSVQLWSGFLNKKYRQNCLIYQVLSHSMVCVSICRVLAVILGMCHSSTCPPYIRPGMSLHMISFTRPSPTLVLQTTNAGMRRTGYYEARSVTPVGAILTCMSVNMSMAIQRLSVTVGQYQ